MNYEEAIELLEEVKELDDSMYAYSQSYNDALEIAIDAVKLQIPQKPEKLVVTKNISYLICPVCRKSEVAINRRCPYCGQAIDWSEYVF